MNYSSSSTFLIFSWFSISLSSLIFFSTTNKFSIFSFVTKKSRFKSSSMIIMIYRSDDWSDKTSMMMKSSIKILFCSYSIVRFKILFESSTWLQNFLNSCVVCSRIIFASCSMFSLMNAINFFSHWIITFSRFLKKAIKHSVKLNLVLFFCLKIRKLIFNVIAFFWFFFSSSSSAWSFVFELLSRWEIFLHLFNFWFLHSRNINISVYLIFSHVIVYSTNCRDIFLASSFSSSMSMSHKRANFSESWLSV